LRIALLQTTSGIDPAANAHALTVGLEQAAAGGAAIAFTPEMTGLLDRDRARGAKAIVGEADDGVLAAAREAAVRLGMWVHLGSLALRPGGDEVRYVNRAFLIDSGGAIRARYDKLHLFDVDLATGESWRESSAYAPGAGAVVAETPAGALGLSICYDLRFPDLYRALSDAGAELLAVPAAFTVPTGAAHWHVLLRARGLVSCPVCGDAGVGKAPMAPRIAGGGAVAPIDRKAMTRAMVAAQAKMLSGSEDVGANFATEARAIHAGDAEHRVIHGQATVIEAKQLVADGVPVAPLPFPVRDASRDN